MRKTGNSTIKRIRVALQDRLADLIISLPGFDIAYSKYSAIKAIWDVDHLIVQSYVKCELYPHSGDLGLWRFQINHWLDSIAHRRIRGTRRSLGFSDLFEGLFNGPVETLEEFEGYVRRVTADCGPPQVEIDIPRIHDQFRSIMTEICGAISRREYTHINDFYPYNVASQT